MLALGGTVYLAWWLVVEWLLPGSFNPLSGRLLVAAYFAATFTFASLSDRARRHSETLYCLGALLLIGHYFYLLHCNAGDLNWVSGAYVLVFALCASVASLRWLYTCAAVALACGWLVWSLDPMLRTTTFLPGLATVLALCLTVVHTRVRLLESLSESAGRFQSLFDACFEGIAVHDGGRIVDVNAAFAHMFGYTPDELMGRSIDTLSAPQEHDSVACQLGNPSGRYEATGLRKDGSSFAIEISGKDHLYRGRALRLAAVRDISERQRSERERLNLIQEQAARVSAQEALRLRDEFISIASHELRTPITSLLLNLDVFVPRWRAGSQDFEAYASRVRRQLGKMKRLVDELFDVSRLDLGRLPLTKESVDLASVARDAIDALTEDLRRAGCEITLHVADSASGLWDRVRLEQVFENLFRNALTYGAGKPIEVSVGSNAHGRATLTVRDRGMGIAPALRERIFLRYERGVSARHYGGLGLGLYIAKQIVEAHGGAIRVESSVGAGATFEVELPPRYAREEVPLASGS